jgi:glutamate dehydrogenase/leucine dehydrogenase
VIIGDARTGKSEAMFRRFGRFVDSLNGRYITAEDVGMSTVEMVNIRKETKYVAGLPETQWAAAATPAPVTAYGVFCGMKRSRQDRLRHRLAERPQGGRAGCWQCGPPLGGPLVGCWCHGLPHRHP